MMQQLAVIEIMIDGQCEGDRAHWSWRAVDEEDQCVGEDQGLADPHPEVNAIEACAIAALSALRWAKQRAFQETVLYINDQELVNYLADQGTPSPYLAVLIAPILGLLADVNASIEYGDTADKNSPKLGQAQNVDEPAGDEAANEAAVEREQPQVVREVQQWLAEWPLIRGKLAPLIALDAGEHAVSMEAVAQMDALIEALSTLVPEVSTATSM